MANPKIQLRHDTAANWASVNPVLLEGEVGLETDTLKQKVGDGTTAWNDLPYNINYDSFDLPIQKYVDTGLPTWDENKLVYNPVSKVFTPTDTVTGGEYADLHPITFNIPSNINLDSYNDSWALIIPNGVFTVNSTNVSNLNCVYIYAEDGNIISRLWYGASSWRKGNSASTIGSVTGREWNIQHLSGQTITYIKGLPESWNSLSQDCTFISTAGRINKVVVFVNSQMNMNVPVGNITLNKIDSSGNILEEYPLITESTQPQIKLAYNPNNLTVNSSNQLDTVINLSEINNKVEKSGDTMTGKLTVPQLTLENNTFTRYITKCNTWERGTNPSEDTNCGLAIEDKNSNGTAAHRYGEFVVQSNSDGNIHCSMTAYKNQVATANTGLQVGYNAAGNAYTYAPACDINNSIVTTVSHTYSSANNTINAVKFGNGLIINWGRVSLNGVISSSNKVITFAIPYTTNAKVVASRNANAGQTIPVVVGWEGTTSFTIGCPSGSSATGYVNFIAIGY